MDPWWLILVSPFMSAGLILALIAPAHRFGLVDHPGGRKWHDVPTPLLGGLAIFLTFLAMNALAGGLAGSSLSLFGAMMVVVTIGVADDINDLGHGIKFFVQICAALIIVSGTTVHVTHFGDILGQGDVTLGKWSILVTMLALIGLMNAINMIDGVDGLAGALALIGALVLAGLAIAHRETRLAFEILLLAGAIAGFLFLNLRSRWRSRATVFMGDAGSLLLGLLLAWYSIQLSGDSAPMVGPITVVWVMGVPLLDMGSVMLLRILQRKSPFHADRQHVHYMLLDAGYAVNQVVAILSGFALACGLIGVLANLAGVPDSVMFLLFIGLWAGHLLALSRPKVASGIVTRVFRPRRQTV